MADADAGGIEDAGFNPDADCVAVPPSTAEVVNGRCVVTLSEIPGAGVDGTTYFYPLAVDETYAYFFDWAPIPGAGPAPGTLDRVPVVGGPHDVVVPNATGPIPMGWGPISAIAVAATHVYWWVELSLSPAPPAPNWFLGGAPSAGVPEGGVATILANGSGVDLSYCGSNDPIAVDAKNVYFFTESGSGPCDLWSVAVGGGAVTDLSPDEPGLFPAGFAPEGVVDGYVYGCNAVGGFLGPLGLVRMPVHGLPEGGANSPIYDGGCSAAAFDKTSAYVRINDHGPFDASIVGTPAAEFIYSTTILRVPLHGGAPTTIVSPSPAVEYPVNKVAVDDTNVYWLSVRAGASDGGPSTAILAAPIAGGAVTTLATDPAWPSVIAVNDAGVYWTNSRGQVKRVFPK